MGDIEDCPCVQFVSFKPKREFCDGLFQEAWIPRADEFRVRGITSIILSKKVGVKNDLCDHVYMSKTWWGSIKAMQTMFPSGLKPFDTKLASNICSSLKAPITPTQIGCYFVEFTQAVDKDADTERYKKVRMDDVKVCIMFSEELQAKEIKQKAECLCLVKGFQSYCIYRLHSVDNDSQFYTWIIEAFFQEFFQDDVLQEVFDSNNFKDCELTVHKDNMEIKI